MTKNSGVAGKTVDQLRRSIEAKSRLDARASRGADEQLELLASRPGQSLKERRRLNVMFGDRL